MLWLMYLNWSCQAHELIVKTVEWESITTKNEIKFGVIVLLPWPPWKYETFAYALMFIFWSLFPSCFGFCFFEFRFCYCIWSNLTLIPCYVVRPLFGVAWKLLCHVIKMCVNYHVWCRKNEQFNIKVPNNLLITYGTPNLNLHHISNGKKPTRGRIKVMKFDLYVIE